MSKCKDSNLGELLHAYELNALSEEDTERFETHLLECEHCFNQLKNFEQEAVLLSSDDEVKKIIREAVVEEFPRSESFLKRLWRYIWPETPLVFKPVLAYIVILLMILPAYYGLKRSPEQRIMSVQQISLIPDRSGEESLFKVSAGGRGLIRFVFREAIAGEKYHVVIQSEDGRVIFQDDSFDKFDEYGTGLLSLPLAKAKPGSYRLLITDPLAEPPLNKQEYSFSIEK
jgi:Asp-tRNA(Asn)/Glu-tRNA(Gln) amidotransferase C subunit